MTEWSPQQEAAIEAVRKWLCDPEAPQVFSLFGFAGTGKTTLAKEIAGDTHSVMYGAFTGKAASVMRSKGCRGASTIHSMIYKLDEEEGDNRSPTFILNRESKVKGSSLVIIDECSMVDEQLGKDLLSFGTKILVLGDPAQLPPIRGAGFFIKPDPDVMLTEVHRQARDNPIIALSMKIRQGEKLEIGQYGESRVISREDITPEDVLEADQVLVGLNRTRQLYNARIRTLLGRPMATPVRDDKLVCLRNDRMAGVLNGSLWNVDKFRRLKNNIISLNLMPNGEEGGREKTVKVREEFFTDVEVAIPWTERKGTQEFTYGYALTCHKSQGSQWNNVVIFDEGGSFREEAKRWRYTAITRAAEKVTVVV